MVKAQQYLDENYPKDGICQIGTNNKGSDGKEGWNNRGKKKEQITKLDISNRNLEGKIILNNFPNLEKIDCRGNKELVSIELNNLSQLGWLNANNCQLTDIKIENCPNITYFNVANNLLTDLNFLTNLNPENLTILSVHSNNFSKQGLEFFSKLINLEQLFLDNCDKEKLRKRIYNRFVGSLKPLQSLIKLEILSIGATNIDSGLEYLPQSLRKIGFNSAWRAETGCAKISKELEKVSRLPGVTEKLIQRGKNSKGEEDPEWINSYYRIAPWRESQHLNGEEEKIRKQLVQQKTEELLGKFPKNVPFLNVSGRELEGNLDLRDFTGLEKLDCSDNKLTGLDLSNCQSLTHLYCDNNLFTDLEFLKTISHPEKLKELFISDNKELSEQNLSFLTPFVGIEELNIENCSFKGSLDWLKKMKQLRCIFISGTDIDSGLDDLPESCQTIYCNFSYQSKKKSIKIVKELSKHSGEEGYNLLKWKEDKQNDMIASIIPLERLYVIRGNLKQFLKKWGTTKDKHGLNELSRLQSPEELLKDRWTIYTTQFIGRGAAVVGAALTFQEQGAIGGGILAVYPFSELLVAKLEKNLEIKKDKWKEFLANADNFLDNYNELLGIISQFEIDETKKGGVNKKLKSLSDKIKELLLIYDEDGNDEIDISELINKRKELVKDFNEEKNKVEGIVDAIKELEIEIIDYRQSSYYGTSRKEAKRASNQLEEVQTNIEISGREVATDNQLISTSNDSSTRLLEGKNAFSTSSTSQSANIFRRRSINKQQNEDIEMGIRNKDQQLEAHQEISLK